MKAFLKNYSQSPRKVRLVASLIKGKKVSEALTILDNTPRHVTLALGKLLKSAITNAKSQGKDEKLLMVGALRVDPGIVMKRIMPRARGSAYRIKKRTSRILLELKELEAKK